MLGVDKRQGTIQKITGAGSETLRVANPALLTAASRNGKGEEWLSRRTPDASAPAGNHGLLAAYASAMDPRGALYLALSPYNRNEGAVIAEVQSSGSSRTLRCALPSVQVDGKPAVASPARIAASSDRLFLISGSGVIAAYPTQGE